MSNFFDDMSGDALRSSPHRVRFSGETPIAQFDQFRDAMARSETLELVRAYHTIEKLIVRKRISEMMKSIATMLLGE